MPSSVELIATLPAVFPLSNIAAPSAGQLKALRCDMTAVNTDLEVVAPETTDGYLAVMGIQVSKAQALALKFNSGTASQDKKELVTLALGAGIPLSIPISGSPFLIVEKGKSLVIQVDVQPATVLLYVAEFKGFKF